MGQFYQFDKEENVYCVPNKSDSAENVSTRTKQSWILRVHLSIQNRLEERMEGREPCQECQ